MKVSTDACIFGACAPVSDSVKTVLDIGTGTGLLSLMLAQRNENIHIDAIEIDDDAAAQAAENIASSPWSERIHVIHADVKEYAFTHQYDMVICNPPFFNNSLLGDNDSRNNVRHTISLSFENLFAVIKRVLKPEGYACIILPATEHDVWNSIVIKNGWGVERLLKVYPKKDVPYNRVVSICVPNTTGVIEESLQIYEDDKTYTSDFVKLMQAFYLKL
ncbi:MAG: methyltransferase [Bacteroidetes bacterium]|nr:methyltransferase [Bacteroidota bacterium]